MITDKINDIIAGINKAKEDISELRHTSFPTCLDDCVDAAIKIEKLESSLDKLEKSLKDISDLIENASGNVI